MDKISRCSQGEEHVWFGNLRFYYYMSLGSADLQHALKQFTGKVAGLGVSMSKSEAKVSLSENDGLFHAGWRWVTILYVCSGIAGSFS